VENPPFVDSFPTKNHWFSASFTPGYLHEISKLRMHPHNFYNLTMDFFKAVKSSVYHSLPGGHHQKLTSPEINQHPAIVNVGFCLYEPILTNINKYFMINQDLSLSIITNYLPE
jgi:hypothetical protein